MNEGDIPFSSNKNGTKIINDELARLSNPHAKVAKINCLCLKNDSRDFFSCRSLDTCTVSDSKRELKRKTIKSTKPNIIIANRQLVKDTKNTNMEGIITVPISPSAVKLPISRPRVCLSLHLVIKSIPMT